MIGPDECAIAGPAAASRATAASSTAMSTIVRLADIAGRVPNEPTSVNCGSPDARLLHVVDSLTGQESLWDHNVPP